MAPMEVWHVRHGERCDEVSGAERRDWEHSHVYRQRRGFYDPPLTRYGHVQASRAGLYIKSVLSFDRGTGRDPISGFDRVYTSPLMRAVQTAVCVSQALGNLPLQVAPGLCSCTAALVRIGYDRAEVIMTDADIAAAFPEVNLIPRDPLTPTSFRGAQAWLAARPDRRVLAVGHREGTKAMAGRHVPTPHCCIGIFKVNRADKSYTLRHMLSCAGKPLEPTRSSRAAVPPPPQPQQPQPRRLLRRRQSGTADGNAAAGEDQESAETLAARVIALSITRNYGGSSGASGGASGATSGARGASDAISASGDTGVTPEDRPLPTTTRVLPKPAGDAAGAADRYGQASSEATAAVTHGKVGDVVAGDQKARPPPLPEHRRHANGNPAAAAPAAAPAAAAAAPAAAAAAAARTGGGDTDLEGRGKPVTAAAATPARGACAGRGFRVAALSRRSVSGAGSASVRHPGVAVGVLSGPMGVLSFLCPFELCTAQAVCKDIAVAAISGELWIEFFSLLHGRRRAGGKEIYSRYLPKIAGWAEGATDPKVLFVRLLLAIMAARETRAKGHVARSKFRSTGIYHLRRSVDRIRMKLNVRLDGEPTSLVNTRGSRTEAWVSRGNLLSEPSSDCGVRRFSLSSSAKVRVPAGLPTSQVLPSMSAAWSRQEAWSPRVTMVRTDRPLRLSQARLLGKSTDGGIALYEVTGLDGRGARSGGGGGGGSSSSSRSSSVLPYTKRACVLLGVFDDAEQAGQCPSGRIAFLTVHFPHDLLIDAATGRFRSGLLSDAPLLARNKPVFSVALGLRTAGVPLWEKACSGVSACLRSRYGARNDDATCRRSRPSGNEGEQDRSVMRIDLVRPGANELEEVTLNGVPGLLYSTSGGLQGVVDDVLLADFALCNRNCLTLWAFASPIVFEASSPKAAEGGAGTGNSDGGGNCEDDGIFNIAYSEARAGRRRGFVVEPGVGRVIVELALVETSDGSGSGSGDGDDDKAATRNSNKRCPPGHAWIVRAARVELELSFVNAWMGPAIAE
ncbi:unnamed protein product [Laminaria digitata]